MPGFKRIQRVQTGSDPVDRMQSNIARTVEPQLEELYSKAAVVQPPTLVGGTQTGKIYMDAGAPSDTYGNSGDVFLRTDAPGTANQRLYVKNGSTWTGIL